MGSIYDGKQYWLTPPALYKQLDEEFRFTFDPTPFPKPKGWDALSMEWDQVNYANPPFRKKDGAGYGPTAFVRKAIEEHKKGKTVVLTIPVQSYVNLLMEAGAEYRSLGRVRWLETTTKEPMPGPSPTGCFILRGTPRTKCPWCGKYFKNLQAHYAGQRHPKPPAPLKGER